MKTLRCMIIILMASAFCASAQEAGSQGDFHFRKDTDPFLSLSNAASLSHLGQGGFSVIEAASSKGNGGYVPIEGSDDDVNASVQTESFTRISDRMVFHGLLSYSYFNGKNMGGPILMDPSYNPVGFHEPMEDTRGTKRRELYRLVGGMSYSLGDRLALGMDFDYESGDQAKVKDPRFSNIWMDMRVSPALWFKASDRLSMGMSLHYRNTLESVVGGIFGTTDRQYYIFTDKGNFAGVAEQLEGEFNYMPTSVARPMSNTFYGMSLQLVKSGTVRFTNELSAFYRTGYYGKRSSTTPTFFEFDGLDLGYEASLLVPSSDDIHRLSFSAGLKTLSNEENYFRYVTPPGQNTVVEYYAKNHLSESLSASASLSYDAWLGVRSRLPELEYGASVNVSMLDRKMSIYPFSRSHDHVTVDVDSHFRKNFLRDRFCFSIGADVRFRTGGGTALSDFLAASSQVKIILCDGLMYRQFEYDTATALGAGLDLRCTWMLKSGASVYVKLGDSYMSLLKEASYLYSSGRRNTAAITVGYSF